MKFNDLVILLESEDSRRLNPGDKYYYSYRNKDYRQLFFVDQTEEVWVNKDNVLHRVNGPAYQVINGQLPTEEIWKINGVFHRDGDLPADIRRDEHGNKEWEAYYKNGKLHRLTGPAVIDYDEEEYHINGREYTKEQFEAFLKDVDTKDIDMLSDLGQTFE